MVKFSVAEQLELQCPIWYRCMMAEASCKPFKFKPDWLRDCCWVGDYSCIDNTAHKYSNSINTSWASVHHILLVSWAMRICNTVWACAQFKFKSSYHSAMKSRNWHIGMPVGLSADLRWRIVYLICLRGYTIAQTAKDLYASHSIVERIADL